MIRPTTVIESERLSDRLGVRVVLASETFQRTGSFKFRAAYHVASHVSENILIAASSGNFGQALASACSLLGKSSIIVMPKTSAQVKVEAVRAFGGKVEFVDVNAKSRAERVSELAKEYPDAYIASAYDDPLVIAGNASLGREIAALDSSVDTVIAPVGGGGLMSGILTGLREAGRNIEAIGAEPLLGNDAAQSLATGKIIRNEVEPQTIADGARTISLGVRNWEILKDRLKGIVEVPEDQIRQAVRLLFSLANLKVEPTGALSVAALLTETTAFRDRSVCCVVSGGNVDPAVYAGILRE
jgi:threonine dehydratase